MDRSITYSLPPHTPSKTCVGLPSATIVPTPVRVKNAGMPAPPARMRSASVPCGVNSSSSSPDRNCRSNSLFSPTYDEIILLIWRVASSSPRPKPSTPALLLTQVRFLTPLSRSAAISASGMPHRPKPPTAIVCPSFTTSASAAAAEGYTLFIVPPAVEASILSDRLPHPVGPRQRFSGRVVVPHEHTAARGIGHAR